MAINACDRGARRDTDAVGKRRRRWWKGLLFGTMALGVGLTLAWCVGTVVWSQVREGRRDRCVQNMKRLGEALLAYHDRHGRLPAAAIHGKNGERLLSWRVALLPELGLGALYDRFHHDEPWDSPHNRALLAEMPPVFACPSDPAGRSGKTVYHAVVGPKVTPNGTGTMFEWERGVDLREVTDGTINTAMVVETTRPVPWTKPDDVVFDPATTLPPALGSRHPATFAVLFADGTVRRLRYNLEHTAIHGVLTRDGGEVLGGG